MQIVATVLVSFSVLLLMIAPFRPAVAGCCSAKALGLAGGALMAAYGFFQLLAFLLVVALEKTVDDLDDIGGCGCVGARRKVNASEVLLSLPGTEYDGRIKLGDS